MENSLKKSYPRAIPHRSPEEMAAQSDRLRASMERLAAQSARLRRWMFVLAAGFAGVLLFGAGSVIYLLNANSSLSMTAGPSPPTDNNEGVPLVSPTPPAPAAGPAVAGKNDGTKHATETQIPTIAAKAKPTGESAEPMQQEMFLETLGGLSAANLYQGYLNIGLLADGVENKAITVEAATSTLKIVTNCLGLVDKKLARLDKLALEADDQDALEQIRAVTELLRLQTQTLLAYWATGKMQQSEDYEKSRKASWTALSKVLALEPAP